jgi:3',5'-cyclic AMP phosphodiesterase CpdA
MTPQTYQRLSLASLVIIAVSLSVIVTVEYVVPVSADWYFQDEYRKLAAECDQAMHDEVALRPGTAGAAKHPTLSLSADVELVVCHDYDKLRKRMLAFGVSEQTLALHGVEAIENERIPVSRMADPHRMERF